MTQPTFDANSRLRFAPSPTGHLHVGGARTALYNWLLARRCGGKFILRIEDTDLERSTEASTRGILDGMRWLGLTWDEGPILQSERIARHHWAARAMIDSGHAYPCFCPPQRLERLREEARAKGEDFTYDGACRDLAREEAQRRIKAGEPHVVRFRIEPGRTVAFEDLIGGARRFETDVLGDFIIQRSDGSPVFHLSVVVDDHDMGITHILRGDDHVPNTPRQILLFEALGWTPPQYGHLPMIQGPDRTRLSKRHGATSVLDFEREGFLPEALVNFLALLGWSFDDKTEIMNREELIERFALERVNRSAAVFDREKLLWMNGVYLRNLGLERAAALARDFFIQDGLSVGQLPEPWFRALVAMELERSRTLREMREHLDFFFVDTIAEYDEPGARKHFLAPGADQRLARLEATLAATPFEPLALEAALRALAEQGGEKFGPLIHPLRLALTGRTFSPGIFDVLSALGRERALRRIADARAWIHRQTAVAAQNPIPGPSKGAS